MDASVERYDSRMNARLQNDPASLIAAGRRALEIEGRAIAALLPRLDAVARGDWLLYGAPPAEELASVLAGMGIYVVLLAAAGLFDFSRRNL